MAGELTSFGIQKLWNLLSQEYERFQGVEDQVTELKRDLSLLSSFLKDADAKKHTSAVVKTCVEEIKEIIFDAEDTIETFLLKQNLGKTSGIKMRIRRLACIIPDRREISLDIAGIRTRISDVIENKELIGYLVEENNVQVVSVTGMGGLGKTTLARQVFNHEDVKRQFDGLAWVCVSQDFTQKNVWQKILVALKPKEEEKKILEMTESTLQSDLFRLLETSKSLIVLDDMWKEEDWNLIKPIFPPKRGWKVLVTSRNEGVVMRSSNTTSIINFKLECLTREDSWTLFQRIAFPKKDPSESKIDEEMEEMGKQMIKHCGGLPLAIKVLGGLLAAKYTLHDWKRLSENIGSRLLGGITDFNADNNNSVNYVLSLSFEELPSYLKLCFLYLAHFPEDYYIRVEKLCYYWAAEGIYEPRHYDGETIQDVGEVYIEELVRRNMVISEREATTWRFETCHLHDMMREVCLFKAKEENFLQITSSRPPTANFQSTVTSRRFVSHNPTTLHVERDINNPKLRSLVVVQVNGEEWKLSCSNYTRLDLLRVLDLYKAKFKKGKLPSGIGKLIHLRYLSLEDAEVSHLPSSLGNLKLLIYLNLVIIPIPTLVPNVLMGMQELRYLALPNRMRRKTKLELSNQVNLETLKYFSTENSSLEDLRGMVKLRTLIIRLTEETSMETVSASIGGLRYLENLYIDNNERIEKDIVLDFVSLKKLILSMRMTRLPKEQHFPSRLMILYLEGCCLEEDPMPILEKLTQLKEVRLWFQAFIGRRMICSGGGFPKLQNLWLVGQEEWEEWIIEEGSMPLLHTLKLFYCPKFKELPDGLRFLHSLKDLTMDMVWKERLSVGGADHHKVKHIPSVNYY